MAFPASTIMSLPDVLRALQSVAQDIKAQGGNALSSLQNTNVSTTFVFRVLDQLGGLILSLNAWKNTAGLNAYATANLPGYAGTMTNDIATVQSAAQACIDWVVANFPKDSTNTFLLAESLISDGSRTQRTFTPAQTSGLQTLLQALIATIG